MDFVPYCICFLYWLFILRHLKSAFLFSKNYLFMLAVLGLCIAQAFHSLQRAGFSLLWLLLLQSMGPRCSGFSSSSWAQCLRLRGSRAQLSSCDA